MDIIKIVRISETLAVLTIGLYWLIFPNSFSEPLIIISGGLAVLIGEIINLSIKKGDEAKNNVESNVYWAIFILVLIFSCLGIYTFHYYSNENGMEGFSPLLIIGCLFFAIFVIWIGFEKQIQRYFEIPRGYLIIDRNKREWKNIHTEKAIRIKYNQHVTNKRKMVTYILDDITDIEPRKKWNYQDGDGYYGTIKSEIKSVSFTK